MLQAGIHIYGFSGVFACLAPQYVEEFQSVPFSVLPGPGIFKQILSRLPGQVIDEFHHVPVTGNDMFVVGLGVVHHLPGRHGPLDDEHLVDNVIITFVQGAGLPGPPVKPVMNDT
jgi:hypothetical protein